MKKTILVFLLLAVLLCCIVACDSSESTPDQTTETTAENTTETTTDSTTENTTANTTENTTVTTEDPGPSIPEVKIPMSDLAKYVIIRPEKSTNATISLADRLKASVNALEGGASCIVKPDPIIPGFLMYQEQEYEILIGDTNRAQTLAYKKNLRGNDYGYTLIDKKIVIFGFNDETLEKAIDLFISQVLGDNALSDGVLFATSDSVTKEGEYHINRVMIGGVAIKNCVIVYPKDDANAENCAHDLEAFLLDEVGYWVPVQSDETARQDGVYEILIGKTNREGQAPDDLEKDEAYIVSDEESTTITGGGGLGIYHACTLFKESFVPKANRIVVDFEEPLRSHGDERMLRVMSFNVKCSDLTDKRMKNVPLCIRNYMPDVLGVQEATPIWMNILKQQLPEYASVGVGRNETLDGEHSAIFYKRTMFTLLDSGTYWLSDTPTVAGSKFDETIYIRIVTYAILQRKSDGKTFFYANTHLDVANFNIKQLNVMFSVIDQHNPENYPVIFTGDLNLDPTSDSYAHIKNAGFVDTSRVAQTVESAANLIGLPGTIGNESGRSIIDYVFAKIPSLFVEKYRVCNERYDGEFPSDHRAIFSDIYLN